MEIKINFLKVTMEFTFVVSDRGKIIKDKTTRDGIVVAHSNSCQQNACIETIQALHRFLSLPRLHAWQEKASLLSWTSITA